MNMDKVRPHRHQMFSHSHVVELHLNQKDLLKQRHESKIHTHTHTQHLSETQKTSITRRQD